MKVLLSGPRAHGPTRVALVPAVAPHLCNRFLAGSQVGLTLVTGLPPRMWSEAAKRTPRRKEDEMDGKEATGKEATPSRRRRFASAGLVAAGLFAGAILAGTHLAGAQSATSTPAASTSARPGTEARIPQSWATGRRNAPHRWHCQQGEGGSACRGGGRHDHPGRNGLGGLAGARRTCRSPMEASSR